MVKPRMLIVTTKADFSLQLFYTAESKVLIEPHHIFYDDSDENRNTVLKHNFDYVYFRDPFNDSSVSLEIARVSTDKILHRYPHTYSVDGISSFKDMLFEDKWNQYKLFPQLMPHTEVLTVKDINTTGNFVKKRISARSKDIIFSNKDFSPAAKTEDYIVQPKLNIKVEYRVYMVGGEMIEPLAVKSSKTTRSRVKLIGLEHSIDPEISKICNAAYDITKFDLMGLDIAKTANGYMLLEVNRSCQFIRYLSLSSQNIAALLNARLLSKRASLSID